MLVHVLTLFPDLFRGFLDESIVRIAQEKGALEVDTIDFRRFATDKHAMVDDRPFGGGPGMVLKPEPIFAAVDAVEAERGPVHRVLLTPTGRPLVQEDLERLARLPELLLLCGRYEGFDERVRLGISWEEISIGDYVLSGGEVPAMVIVDGIARLLPGVLGDEESAVRESFREGLLDHPQFTRPRVFRGMEVPEVLLSGDHARIEAWRREEALRRTRERRRALSGPERRDDGQQRPDGAPTD
ncbi:MAG: tRNA (guanosine(37)-N1)-methyltransferase TrmD [Planctomycetota bacterium JB042]